MYVPEGVPYPDGIDPEKAPQVMETFESDFRTCTVNRVDNTVIAPYLASLIGGDLEEMTQKYSPQIRTEKSYIRNLQRIHLSSTILKGSSHFHNPDDIGEGTQADKY